MYGKEGSKPDKATRSSRVNDLASKMASISSTFIVGVGMLPSTREANDVRASRRPKETSQLGPCSYKTHIDMIIILEVKIGLG